MPDNDDVPLIGKIKDKLVAAKEGWARDGRALTGGHGKERLPPGQHLVNDWPVLDLGVTPNLTPKDWQLSVAGNVDNPVKWSWDDFMAQPQVEMVSDMHCVTTWSRYDNLWAGVSTRHFLDVVKPRAGVKFVVLKSYDGYATNLPIEHFAAEDAIIAHSWQGEPLSRQHGGPVRVIVPKLYLWKSAKWLRHITFLDQDAPGYWEVRGYHDVGDPWREERYR